jgi:pyruvate dehydrogenase E1 component
MSDYDLAPYLNPVGGGDANPGETREWLEAFQQVVDREGRERGRELLAALLRSGHGHGVPLPFTGFTDYLNTIPKEQEPPYPGDLQIEGRIRRIAGWNAVAMVVRANKKHKGIGGHLSTFASASTIFQVGMNHFWRGRGESGFSGDSIYFQGHASPGPYSYAFLEGRLTVEQLEAFRRELSGGLPSYPHPWLLPNFWEHPTVSMGLSPLSGIYQAKFNRYLRNRGLVEPEGRKIWVFLGDGESDEPESLGALTLASRENLDNLIFVVNCNLQRLDGPVRGNGKIIQELETAFRGAGWNVIKVVWGSDWDPLLAADTSGALVRRMNEALDGDYQKYATDGAYTRAHFFGRSPELRRLIEGFSDEQLLRLRRGGHDPLKVHAAFKAAVEHRGSPTAILVKTVKGFGLGEAGEGKNVAHQVKEMNLEAIRAFRDRLEIPVADADLADFPFYHPGEKSPEIEYFREHRKALGGPVPRRLTRREPLATPTGDLWKNFLAGSNREVSTTMAFVQMLTQLLKDKEIGKRIVPIVPDEARTFGMESLFPQFKIYSSAGQQYEPVDKGMLLSYQEDKAGQILEEGITEAGSMASFIAAGTSYATHGVDMIPFFIFYSMFGFQRVGDLIWAAADQRTRGFLMGATFGRTTLNGEGLQHEDGHSLLLASVVPNLLAYEPAYAYEIAVIVREGLQRMYTRRDEVFYYITLANENYPMPPMPLPQETTEEGILKGLYKVRDVPPVEGEGQTDHRPRVHLLGSGVLLREAIRAADLLAQRFGVAADVWSATSYKELRRDAIEADRWNLLHPDQERRTPYVTSVLGGDDHPIVAVSDSLRTVPDQVARWLPGRFFALGTDGFGRSDTREALRRFFEVDAECVAVAALHQLAERGKVDRLLVRRAIVDLGIDPDKADPLVS